MTQRCVEIAIGKLTTDEGLRRLLHEAPEAAVERLRTEGLELSAVEAAALAGLDPDAFERFAHALDPRLMKACLDAVPRAAERPPRPRARRPLRHKRS